MLGVYRNYKSLFLLMLAVGIAVALQHCVDTVSPEFDYQDDILFVEAYALTEPGISSVKIEKTFFENEVYRVEPVANADVKMENMLIDRTSC